MTMNSSNKLLGLCLALAFAAAQAQAGQIWKAGSTGDLNLTTSWWTTETGPTNPAAIGTTDALRFGGSGQGATIASIALGGDLTVGGIRLDNNTGTPNYNVTIAAGNTLTLNGASTADIAYATAGIVLNSGTGGTLTINSDVALGAAQQWVTSRSVTVGGNLNLGANTLTSYTAGSGSITLDGIVSGTKASGSNAILLNGTSTGTLRLTNASNSFTGNIEFSGGSVNTLEFTSAGALGSTAQIRFRNTSGTSGAGSILRYTGTTAATITKEILCDTSIGMRIESNSVGGSLTLNGTWNQSNRPLTLGGTGMGNNTLQQVFTGTGTLTKNGTGTWILSGANTHSGATLVDGGTLTVNNTLRSTSGLSVNSGATVNLNGLNTFTTGHGVAMAASRVLTVKGGTLVMENTEARFGNVTLQNGATWTSNRGLASWDWLLANTDTGAATVTVSNTSGTAPSLMNGTGGIHIQGVQNFNVADVTGNTNADLTVSMTLADPGMAGGSAGGINKTGAGTMAISKQTTYTGGTTVSDGVLDLTGGGGSGGTIRGTATVNTGGTLRLSIGDATGYGTGSDRISVMNLAGGTLNVNTTSNQTASNLAITMTGGTISGITNSNLDLFNNGTSITSLASATSSVISIPKLGLRQDNSTFTVAEGSAEPDLVVSSVLWDSDGTGNNALIKVGAGTMVLSASNTYTGNTTINGGVLELTATGKLYNGGWNNSAVVTVNAGGTWRMPDYSYAGVGQLADYAQTRVISGGTIEVTGGTQNSGQDFTVDADGGTFRYSPANTADVLTLRGNNNSDITLNGSLTFDTVGNITVDDPADANSGIIAGTGSLIKTGSGTLTLNAANTYTGATTVAAGTLVVDGSIASSSLTTVNAGATLMGSGTVGATTVNGTLAPGNSIDTLIINGDLVLAGTSDFEIDPNGVLADLADLAAVSGNLTYGGTLNVTNIGGAFSWGDTFNLFDWAGALTGNFTAVYLPTLTNPAWSWQNNLTLDGTITVVPEPAATLGLALLLSGALLRRRRHS